MKARIRYLAYLSDNPDELAGFYARHLDLDELGRTPEGDVSVSDGFYNISFLKRRPGLHEPHNEIGLHHIGLEVDNLDEAVQRYRAHNDKWPVCDEPGGLAFGEKRVYDPEGNPISLSSGSFGVRERTNRVPRLRHIAFNALWPEGVLNFYMLVFGFRELSDSFKRREQGRGNRFGGDGWTNLAIHPFYSDVEGHEPRYGVNHVGFLVGDIQQKLEAFGREVPVSKRPDWRPYAEFRLRDKEGNGFDLSQTKGWEVDLNKWERAA
ncbi:MAG TPA: VOC family protein [Alphaproteobacteria bacterium]|nr:VOC family protein [Alphaproteobacteria bacterium]